MNSVSSRNRKVSVIIPAHNEAETVGSIIRIAKEHPLVDEVIVVDDGSADQTAAVAFTAGARVIRHRFSRGKAGAMEAGVRKASGQIFCFLDADICGLDSRKLTAIIQPVLSGKFAMFVGICGRKTDFMNSLLEISPVLGGQRALTRRVWKEVPHEYKENFQIEIALNYFTKKTGRKMGFRVLKGVTQVIKEKKRGVWLGLYQRCGMVKDLILITFRLYVFYSLKTALSPLKN